MDAATIVELIKQPETVIIILVVVFLLFTTSIGKMVIKKITIKYFGGAEDDISTQIFCLRKEIDELKGEISNLREEIIQGELEKHKAVDKAVAIYELKNIKLIAAQMKQVKRLSDKCKNILLEDFDKLMVGNDNANKERRAYKHILNTSFIPTEDKLRTWVIDNHLTSRPDDKFRDYVEETTMETMEDATANIDNNYLSEDFSITRVELKKLNYENSGKDLVKVISDTLYELRDISRKYEEKIGIIKDE